MMEQGQKIAILAIVVNVVLFATKYMFAGLSGSIDLKGGAFDSMSDVVASSTVFVGLVISRRKTTSFPYRLYKVENLVSVIVALVILYIGYEIVQEAMGERGVRLQNVTLAAAGLLGVVTIGYGFSRYEARVGRALNSPSLMADAKHMRADMFTKSVVLVGLCSNYIRVDFDRIAAFVIVVFIAATSDRIIIDGIRVLLYASYDSHNPLLY
jgi:cation diffusion facilitator family transporter